MIWHRTDKRLPPKGMEVLLYYLGGPELTESNWSGCGIGFMISWGPSQVKWVANQGFAQPEIAPPTHWMRLPTPPKPKKRMP